MNDRMPCRITDDPYYDDPYYDYNELEEENSDDAYDRQRQEELDDAWEKET